ncbi:UDP-N-acetylmuramoyl-L-alanyl-D-glutamate--2,6-diaminopimelate ligase [uncultured Brachyspira sp.]|uniref:UDP-N-acetylmuramoyl-L-alanyl-D-glutamate--2, 6-diaminopimelate ligase n=2 Tax=uncultured Brachyspira sp. TaxID=221953 RepID=UPI0026388912|nr:UDP-N-acetylmuramoyl-L-alanyl-D-glutamate--2,6-diaminopimelate ligase [uncultured Brachyspira sp.]
MKYFKELIKDYKVSKEKQLTEECLNTEIKGISYNSRLIKKNYLFTAIKGLKDDGHKYIENAVKNKAVIIIYDNAADKNLIKELKRKYNKVYFIAVKNPRECLAYISAKFFDEPTKKINTIAITGTNGKTTTTYLLKSVLEASKYKTALIGTIKNMIGKSEIKTNLTTPESIDLENIFYKSLKKEVSHIVMESSSQALAMNRCDYLNYDTAIFTNITEDHLDYHKDMQSYLKAKLKLFSLLKESSKKKKLAIINIDTNNFNQIYNYIKKLGIKIVTYGINENADYYGKVISLNSKNTEYEFYAKGKFISKVKLSMLGRFNILNSLSVLAYICEYKLDIEKSIKAMRKVQVAGRFEIVTKEKHPFIAAVDYSHTPDSLENILIEARKLNPNRVITVFGCGGDRDRKKRPIMAQIAEKYSDIIILTADNQRTENINQIMNDIEKGFKNNNYKKIIDRKEAIFEAVKEAKKNDIVIIAGKGHETYQIFPDKTIHFDDREEAKEALKKYYPNI